MLSRSLRKRLKQRLLRPVQTVLARAGYSAIRLEALNRPTMFGVIEGAKNRGLEVATLVDVGAAFGDWTRQVSQLYPSAGAILIEPLEEFHPFLDALHEELPRSAIVKAAASRAEARVELHVQPDLFGTSLLAEAQTGLVVDRRTVDGVSLGRIWAESPWIGPCLLKVDVQGAELEVLEGAGSLLEVASMIVVEVSLLEFFNRGPLLDDVVRWLAARDFVVYDVADLLYRPLDGALAQVDIAFVPRMSPLRLNKTYADLAQQTLHEGAFGNLYKVRRAELENQRRRP